MIKVSKGGFRGRSMSLHAMCASDVCSEWDSRCERRSPFGNRLVLVPGRSAMRCCNLRDVVEDRGPGRLAPQYLVRSEMS